MGRPLQEIRVYGIQDGRSQAAAKRPWLVRWSIDGRQKSKAFRTKAEADRYRAQLLLAVGRGDRFDPATGEPASWMPAATSPTVFEWAKTWLAEQWPEWQPRTRRSAIEAIARLVVHAVDDRAGHPPAGTRAQLGSALGPDGAELDAKVAAWIGRWSLPLDELDASRLSGVDRLLGIADSGSPLAASTAARYRKTAKGCIRRAVELGVIGADPWPPTPRGRSKRKATRLHRRIDTRRLPDPPTMARILDAIPSHQPGSHKYRVMTAVIYYAGLRPSEVVMLRPRALHLPAEGWGAHRHHRSRHRLRCSGRAQGRTSFRAGAADSRWDPPAMDHLALP